MDIAGRQIWKTAIHPTSPFARVIMGSASGHDLPSMVNAKERPFWVEIGACDGYSISDFDRRLALTRRRGCAAISSAGHSALRVALVEETGRRHPVGPEASEVLTQFAPGDQVRTVSR